MRTADLHTHTTASDGQLAPAALVEKAAERGIDVLAVTDHDTIDGLAEAQAAGHAAGVELLAGVELSVTVDGVELHLLGYAFDPAHEKLRQHLAHFKETRRERARRMAARLTELGYPLTFDDVERQTAEPGAALGRPHVAQALVAAGHAPDSETAFDRLIGDDGPAFVEKPRFEAGEALALLHEAGGIGALAHPAGWVKHDTFRALVRAGLDAVEVIHPSHNERWRRYWRRKAEKNGLRQTGGSDYHGHREGEDERFGAFTVPARWIFD